MKKVCFIEMEGVLLSHNDYRVNERRAKSFVQDLSTLCREHKTELYLVTGFHESVAHQKFEHSFLKDFFDEKHFLHVNDAYIKGKSEPDEKIHRSSLEKDPEFNDSYFKQVVMQQVLAEKSFSPKEALLFADDLWVDGYYSMRFSKVDFALFEENLLDRGKRAERISGLAYFNLDFSSAKQLLENFPRVDHAGLDKFVFDSMKKAFLGDSAMSAIVNAVKEKQFAQQKTPLAQNPSLNQSPSLTQNPSLNQSSQVQGLNSTIVFDTKYSKKSFSKKNEDSFTKKDLKGKKKR